MQQLLKLVMIICQSKLDMLIRNMRLYVEWRTYKYTRDDVNHFVDVRDTIKESVYFLVDTWNGQG